MPTYSVSRNEAEVYNGYWWKYSGTENLGTINASTYAEIKKTLNISDVFKMWGRGRFVYIVTNTHYYALEEI